MIGWLFLSFGLTLGMLWAYEELGWGGYWMWDPVENAGLLPWFTATAFLHSVRVQEQRGMLRVWNVTLVIVTFFLTIFGTFMTRSGVVQSVHAFGEDRELALLFTIFMVAILTFSFAWVIYRLPLLRSRHELDSFVSREAAFLANNWILLFSAFFVLFATMFPTLSEAVTGERLTVAAPFFNRWMLPIGLDPADADRHRSAARLAQIDGREPRLSVEVAGARRLSSPPSRSMPSGFASGAPASASRCRAMVLDDDRPGVRPRRPGAPRSERHRHPDRAHRPRRPFASAAMAATSSTSASCSCSSASPARASSRKSRR